MLTSSFSLRLPAADELATILRSAGIDAAPIEDAWATEKVSWQLFMCHRNGAIVTASVATMLDGSEPAFITVSTCRKLFGIWLRTSDKRLYGKVVEAIKLAGAIE
jgi:hypothetical protein